MQELLSITNALDNAHRLRIVSSLRGGELCLCQLVEFLQLAPSTVSRHVELLRRAGLVEMRKDGRWHYYRLAGRGASPAVRETLRWIARTLEHQGPAAEDAARLAAVRRMAPEDSTGCYTRN